MKENSNNNWYVGKVVSFSSDQDTLALKNISFELRNDRLFAVGEIPKGGTTNEWARGLSGGVAWDSVTDYMVFDSETQFIERLAKSETGS